MSRRHGLHTDASHRFERGADFESTVLSCDLVAKMILESGGGELVGDVVDVISKTDGPGSGHSARERSAADSGRRAGRGTDLSPAEAAWDSSSYPKGRAMRSFACRSQAGGWMWSARSTSSKRSRGCTGMTSFRTLCRLTVAQSWSCRARRWMQRCASGSLALGYNEALSLTFISHADAEKFSSGTQVLELENPLSEEASVMRTSLVPGMLDMLAWNLNRDVAGCTVVRDWQRVRVSGTRARGASTRVSGSDGRSGADLVACRCHSRREQRRPRGGRGNVPRIQGRCGELAGALCFLC